MIKFSNRQNDFNSYSFTNKNYAAGLFAEEKVASYLKKLDWNILNQRYRCPFGEIDLIAQRADYILFVEVKKRKTLRKALFALTNRQKQRLINSANCYLETYNMNNINNVQFDYIILDFQNRIEHLENITAY
ncbi:YraN family protein [Commensalibacter melissae]|uniref:YraN family protein n=1 Tax=Commensalibacter melissae TaxID=2070537 RepID=UPI000EFACE32|nr:YraN family protein [Commensalibacter melissae]AYN86852.1 YraN family protein [Commensalibacter melissae]